MKRRIPNREEFPYFPPNVQVDSELSLKDLVPGCPAPDCIPSIDKPKFIKITNYQTYFSGDEKVLCLLLIKDNEIKESYVFPISILNYHEIVNFKGSQGEPLALAFCPLCNTATGYYRIVEGSELILGVSGLLYNSALVMYDRNTMSLISQVWSRGITGKYAGKTLPQLPVFQTTLRKVIPQLPHANLLTPETGYARYKNLYQREAYKSYKNSQEIRFPLVNEIDDLLPPKTLVYILKYDSNQIFILPKVHYQNDYYQVINSIISKSFCGGDLFFKSGDRNNVRANNFSWKDLIHSEISYYFAARAYFPDALLISD